MSNETSEQLAVLSGALEAAFKPQFKALSDDNVALKESIEKVQASMTAMLEEQGVAISCIAAMVKALSETGTGVKRAPKTAAAAKKEVAAATNATPAEKPVSPNKGAWFKDACKTQIETAEDKTVSHPFFKKYLDLVEAKEPGFIAGLETHEDVVKRKTPVAKFNTKVTLLWNKIDKTKGEDNNVFSAVIAEHTKAINDYNLRNASPQEVVEQKTPVKE